MLRFVGNSQGVFHSRSPRLFCEQRERLYIGIHETDPSPDSSFHSLLSYLDAFQYDGRFGKKKERKMEYRHIYKRYGMRPTLDSLANALRNAPMTRHNITLSLSLLGNYNPFLPGIYLYIQLFSDAILYFPRSDSDGLRWELRPAPTGRSRPRDWRRTNSLLHRKHQRHRQSLSAWRDDFCGRTARRYAYSSNSR